MRLNGTKGEKILKRSVFRVVFCALVCSALFILSFGGCAEKKAETAPPVEVANVIQQDVPIYAEWVATLDGMVNATIRAQVQGYLTKQSYKEGDTVKKGQVLFQIDPRTFQAAQEQAKGELGRAEARLTQTKANLSRIRPLAAQRAVSQKDLDDAVAAEQSAQAALMSAKAAFDKASLDLSFTRITSPIDGIAGMAKAQMGNLVGPGQIEELTTVSTVNPIKAYCGLSEQEYLKAADSKRQVGRIPLELILADGSIFPHKGEFLYADRQVDVRTGTIRVASIFPNPNNLLRPGQFARIRAQMGIKKNAIATHFSSDRLETVGVCSDGRISVILFSLLRGTFILSPTFSSARSAPLRSITRFSIFLFFQGSFHALLFAMRTVSDSRMVSTILRLLATSDAPVSVTSMMASASNGGFTSVAPQENSMLASMPCFFR